MAELDFSRIDQQLDQRPRDLAERLAAKMASQTGDELYRTRAVLAAEIRRVVERITFDGREQAAAIKVIGHPKLYLVTPSRVSTWARQSGDAAA